MNSIESDTFPAKHNMLLKNQKCFSFFKLCSTKGGTAEHGVPSKSIGRKKYYTEVDWKEPKDIYSTC